MQSLSGLQPGRPWPLGASWDGRGVNFAVVSGHAHRMELCLFDVDGRHELSRTALPGHTHDVWHGYLEGGAPGLVYGYRAHGQWRPDRGHRFNAHKLLLDPYAREIVGTFEWRDEQFGGDPRHTGHLDARDNAAFALKARVVDSRHAAGADAHLHTALEDTVLYEVHVKGFTKLHPDVPAAQRGTYAGLASDASDVLESPNPRIPESLNPRIPESPNPRSPAAPSAAPPPNPLNYRHPGATGFDGFDERMAACPGPGSW